MKELFDFRRFMRYSLVRYSENKVFFFLPLLLIGISLMLIVFNALFDKRIGISVESFQIIISSFGFFILITIYSLKSFSDFHKTQKGFMLATLPASTFEKFLYGVLTSTIVFGVLYIISFFVSAFLISEYNTLVNAQSSGYRYYNNPLFLSTLSLDFRNEFIYCNPFRPFSLIKTVLTISAIYMAGSIFFRKLGFIFTTIITILFIYISINIAAMFLSTTGSAAFGTASEIIILPYWKQNHFLADRSYLVHISEAVMFVSIALVWFATYNRLKEKEY